MVVSQVDGNWGTLDCILWFYGSWWHYTGIICAWPLIKYVYIYIYINVCIYMFMILDGHWQSVCVCVCVWLIIMILVVWITACFFVLTCPHPSRFQFKHDNCVYMCVWFSNDDTCCLNYSMFFCSDLPSPSRFQCWHENSSLENEKKHVGKPSPNWKAKNNCIFHPKWNIIFKNQTITIKEQMLVLSKGIWRHIILRQPHVIPTSILYVYIYI